MKALAAEARESIADLGMMIPMTPQGRGGLSDLPWWAGHPDVSVDLEADLPKKRKLTGTPSELLLTRLVEQRRQEVKGLWAWDFNQFLD